MSDDIKKVIKYSRVFLLSLVVVYVFQLPEILSAWFYNNVNFEQITKSPLHLTSRLNLSEGQYYVTYGLVRAGCSAMVNGSVYDTSISSGNGVKSNLLLGHEFSVTTNVPILLELKCDFQEGFITSLAHAPRVLSVNSGKMLHLYRALTSVVLGIVCAMFLLMVSIFSYFIGGGVFKTRSGSEYYILFSVVGFFYLSSYSQIPRLWLAGADATLLHIVLRNLFATTSFLILANHLGRLKFVPYMFVLIAFAFFFFDYNQRGFMTYYRLNYILFAVVSAIYTVMLIRKREYTKRIQLIRFVAVCWTVAQIIDTISLYTSVISYNTPIVMALTCVAFSYLIIYDRSRLEQLEQATKQIIDLSKTELSPNKLMSDLALMLLEYTQFSRASCYVDAFILAEAPTPLQKMIRVFEKGYIKDTSMDRLIDFSSQRGLKMLSALEQQKVIQSQGDDGGFYAVVPIGRYMTINLSDDHAVSEQQVQASIETLDRLKPGLSSIEKKVNELGTTSGNMLQKIRSVRTESNFESEMFGIMIDILDYSKNTERYQLKGKNNPYTRFISGQYLPGLARALGGFAYPEALEGDLISFVILKDTFQKNKEGIQQGYYESLNAVLDKIQHYLKTTGAEICKNNGFEAVQFSVGVSTSAVQVNLDEFQARTAGEALTIARRILDGAPRGSIAIDKKIFESRADGSVQLPSWRVASERSILVKKDMIDVVLVQYNE
jgi:hypothetical protein